MILDRTAWDEFLVSSDADSRLEALQANGVLRAVFPELQALVGFGGGSSGHKDLWAHTKQVVIQTVPEPKSRWASLFHDVGKPISFDRHEGKITFHHHESASARLFLKAARRSEFFTPHEVAEIAFVIENLGLVEAYEPTWTDSAVRRLTRDLGDYLEAVFAVARADCTSARFERRRKNLGLTHELRTRIDKLKAKAAIPPALPKGLGNALMERLGLREGRELGEVIGKLKARVEAGELPRNAPVEVYLAALG